MFSATPEQKVAFHVRRGVKTWPPHVADRQPGLLYPFFPAHQYVCSCGELIRNTNSALTRPDAEITPWGVKLQHGENREAVMVLHVFDDHILSPALEQRLAKWADEIHEYQRRTAWFSPDGD